MAVALVATLAVGEFRPAAIIVFIMAVAGAYWVGHGVGYKAGGEAAVMRINARRAGR